MLNLLAVSFEVYSAIQLAILILLVVMALFIMIVVLIQPGNSNGISAISGASDTFYEKNKSKTIESRLKKLTVICLIAMAVLMLAYFAIELFVTIA